MRKYRSDGVGIIILFVSLVIAGITGWFYFQPLNNKQENNQIQSTPSPTFDPTESWKTLSNFNHTLKYPREAKAETRESESVISFIGRKQIDSGRTQTELFDGYSFRIGEIINDSKLALEQLSKNERENAQNNCLEREGGQISPLESISIDGQVGYQYSAEGCYIDYTETIVSFESKIYRISQSYVGDVEDQKKYKEITNKILSTLRFEN